ncbi:hypothetical protein [Ralstonia pseudosolanacearum]|uniref:hypothetical protein n=1 Tax=Ralstonia pseudosolanacearum TaxID=1310165 RepID=UPI001FF7C2A5|nr:hypothetical protein [Ralstonia pseudosolanacearum]
MELPESLHRWRDWLDWFAADLQPEVGMLIKRLHPLLGTFLGTRLAGAQEPSGLGNLSRRGAYDRLLASEWLLAQDMPDEFLRRAAGGEHLFLAPPTHSPQADRLIVALFDAGPLQLGAPRLAHLALWVLLARRAREAGGELRWGILQSDPALHAATEAAHLRSLLKARTFGLATAAHHQAWQAWLADHAPRPGECWLIGQEADAGVGVGGPAWTHGVHVRQALTEAAIDVRIRSASTERKLTVSLPPAAIAVRLLKGWFQHETAVAAGMPGLSPHRLATLSPPLLSMQGTHVAVPTLDAPGVMLFHIPKAREAHAAKPRRYRWGPGQQPLAAAFLKKRFCALLSDSGTLHFWQPNRVDTRTRPSRDAFDALPGRRGFLPAAWLNGLRGDCVCVLDLSGRLVYWRVKGTPSAGQQEDDGLQYLASGVIGMAQVHDGVLMYLQRDDGMLVLHRWRALEDGRRWGLGAAADVAEVLFGGGQLWREHFGACAVRKGAQPEQVWTLYSPVQGDSLGFGSVVVRLPAGWRAIGIAQAQGSLVFRLITLDAGRTRLALHGAGAAEVLYTSASPIVQQAVSPAGDLVALLAEDRTLTLYSVRERLIRIQIDGKGAEHAAG